MQPPPLAPTDEFLKMAADLGVEFDPGDLERLGQFLALLLETNKTHNLTAITDPAEAWIKHIFDALTLMPFLAALEEERAARGDAAEGETGGLAVADVGAGGGVPGIPLAIMMPGARFTLVEATGKKAEFLRTAARELGLANVEVVQERAERVGQDHRRRREKYDAAIARALGHLAVVAELTVPLVKVGGLVLAVKGAKADQEVAESAKALSLLRAEHVQTAPTPTGRIVVLSKVAPTPRTYPRRDGEPKRAPLGLPPAARGG
jgi:16S rRNA (guanine527-N7)-methyltransferase